MPLQFTIESSSKSAASKVITALSSSCQNMSVPAHKIVLFTFDLATFFGCAWLSSIIYAYSFGGSIQFVDVLILFISMSASYALLSRFNKILTYQVVLNRQRHLSASFKIITTCVLLIFLLASIFSPNQILANVKFMGVFFLTMLLVTVILRIIIVPRVFYSLVRLGLVNRRLLIVGINETSLSKAEFLRENKDSYFNVIGFIETDDPSSEKLNLTSYKVLGQVQNLTRIVKQNGITDILLCPNVNSEDELFQIIQKCRASEKTIHVISSFYGVVDRKMEVEEVGVLSSFRIYPHSENVAYRTGKRILDILGSTLIIAGLLPLWLFIALMIYMDSKGPIFYTPEMIGKDGKKFRMFKFRSMYHNCSKKSHEDKVRKMILENGDTHKLRNDPRVTKVGRVLRKISFDEFPQLINVFRGEMSLVGPRPCLPYEFEVMKDWQKERASVNPGMTGLWQIKGRDEVLFNEQIILDLYYVEHNSFLFDLVILFETIPVVIFGKGGS